MTARAVRRALAAAATLVAVAAGVGAIPPVAQAAGGMCPQGTGATVVVDFGPLGGGTAVACDPDGAGEAASRVMAHAGFSVTYVNGQPFVCRIEGKPGPAEEDCAATPPADAYWGLFWSDGKSGRWVYATEGVASLDVPAGGFIGWRFQDGGDRENPGVAPKAPAPPAPTPSKKPTPTPTATPSPRPSTQPSTQPSSPPGSQPGGEPRATTTAAPSASAGAGDRDRPGGATSARATPSPTVTPAGRPTEVPAEGTDADPVAAPTGDDTALAAGELDDDGGGALTWLGLAAVVGLGAAAGVVGWRRRSS